MSDVRPGAIVSSTRVETAHGHDRVSVWNRGGLAGVLTVTRGDGDTIAERLENDGSAAADAITRLTEQRDGAIAADLNTRMRWSNSLGYSGPTSIHNAEVRTARAIADLAEAASHVSALLEWLDRAGIDYTGHPAAAWLEQARQKAGPV